MAIQFDEIPSNTRTPGQYIEHNWTGAVNLLPSDAEKCLIIAPVSADVAINPLEILPVFNIDDVGAKFGKTSVIYRMTKAAIYANNRINLSICPLAADSTTVNEALEVIFAAGHTMMATSIMDNTAISAISTYINDVSHAMEQRPAYHFGATTTSIADAISYSQLANNGRMLNCLARGISLQPYEMAAAFMAIAAGESDPARPLNTLGIDGIAIPDVSNWLTENEIETLLHAGVTPMKYTGNGKVQIVRAVTTYTTNAQGVDDPSKLDFTSVRSADYVRKVVRQTVSTRFPREKLTANTINAVWDLIYSTLKKLENAEIVQNVDENKANIVVQKSSFENGRLDASIPTAVIPGFHVFAGKLNIIL